MRDRKFKSYACKYGSVLYVDNVLNPEMPQIGITRRGYDGDSDLTLAWGTEQIRSFWGNYKKYYDDHFTFDAAQIRACLTENQEDVKSAIPEKIKKWLIKKNWLIGDRMKLIKSESDDTEADVREIYKDEDARLYLTSLPGDYESNKVLIYEARNECLASVRLDHLALLEELPKIFTPPDMSAEAALLKTLSHLCIGEYRLNSATLPGGSLLKIKEIDEEKQTAVVTNGFFKETLSFLDLHEMRKNTGHITK